MLFVFKPDELKALNFVTAAPASATCSEVFFITNANERRNS